MCGPFAHPVIAISSNEPWPLKRGLGAAFTCMTKSVMAPLMRNGNGLVSIKPLALACARMKVSVALASRSLSIATARQCCADAVGAVGDLPGEVSMIEGHRIDSYRIDG